MAKCNDADLKCHPIFHKDLNKPLIKKRKQGWLESQMFETVNILDH